MYKVDENKEFHQKSINSNNESPGNNNESQGNTNKHLKELEVH